MHLFVVEKAIPSCTVTEPVRNPPWHPMVKLIGASDARSVRPRMIGSFVAPVELQKVEGGDQMTTLAGIFMPLRGGEMWRRRRRTLLGQ